MAKHIVNKGDKYGRWTIKNEIIWKYRKFLCECDCGKIKEVYYTSLSRKINNSRSCGCYAIEMAIKKQTTHWETKTALYSIWQWSRQRCINITNRAYKNYWGRGIKSEWKTFKEFKLDMWPTYKKWLTLERKENDWNYCKSNCIWETRKKQAWNRRTSIRYKWKCVAQWCEELWIKKYTTYRKIKKGIPLSEIFKT